MEVWVVTSNPFNPNPNPTLPHRDTHTTMVILEMEGGRRRQAVCIRHGLITFK